MSIEHEEKPFFEADASIRFGVHVRSPDGGAVMDVAAGVLRFDASSASNREGARVLAGNLGLENPSSSPNPWVSDVFLLERAVRAVDLKWVTHFVALEYD